MNEKERAEYLINEFYRRVSDVEWSSGIPLRMAVSWAIITCEVALELAKPLDDSLDYCFLEDDEITFEKYWIGVIKELNKMI